MHIQITLYCPNCQSSKVKKNGKKSDKKQNYMCKTCHRQFIGDHALSYKGCHSGIIKRILLMSVRGIGIRDVSVIEGISIKKALSVLVKSSYVLHPKHSHYESLEVDEPRSARRSQFWTYVKEKADKVWLIYAYDRSSGEIVAYVWGRSNLKTAKALRKKCHLHKDLHR